MSQVHGVGPIVALIGGLTAFCGLAGWMRLSSDQATDPNSKMPRVAAFNCRTAPVMKRLGWLGVGVAVIGLVIWAAS